MIVCFLCFSCVNELDEIATPMNQPEPLNLTDGVIIGEKLQNPYSLEVMKQACDLVYPPTRGEEPVSDSLIVPNVKYVRFLPADSTEFRILSESNLELFNYPLDYDILGDPSDYHDPNLPPEQITWQYTVMPIDDPLPIARAELLDVGFIPNAMDSDGLFDLSTIEKTANDIVLNTQKKDPRVGTPIGNGTTPTISEEASSPMGKIQVCDSESGEAKGVKGIKVRARHYWKIRTAYTNDNGEYNIDLEDFDGVRPRYELRFENKYGFKIGYGMQLIMPMSAHLEDWNATTYDWVYDHKLWVACTINNAAYDWYNRCEKEGMSTPPSDLYIWAMEMAGGAACPMFHHNTLQKSGLSIPAIVGQYFEFDNNTANLNIFNSLLELIAPDVVVFRVRDVDVSTRVLYQYTSHELSHATHFQQVGSTVDERAMWWADVIQYEVACGIVEGPYEATGVPHSGKVGVTEMWAHAVGHIMEFEYQSKSLGDYNSGYWFKPEIVWELYKGGMTLQQINKSMTIDIVTLEDFKYQLVEDNEIYKSLIEKQFSDKLGI